MATSIMARIKTVCSLTGRLFLLQFLVPTLYSQALNGSDSLSYETGSTPSSPIEVEETRSAQFQPSLCESSKKSLSAIDGWKRPLLILGKAFDQAYIDLNNKWMLFDTNDQSGHVVNFPPKVVPNNFTIINRCLPDRRGYVLDVDRRLVSVNPHPRLNVDQVMSPQILVSQYLISLSI